MIFFQFSIWPRPCVVHKNCVAADVSFVNYLSRSIMQCLSGIKESWAWAELSMELGKLNMEAHLGLLGVGSAHVVMEWTRLLLPLLHAWSLVRYWSRLNGYWWPVSQVQTSLRWSPSHVTRMWSKHLLLRHCRLWPGSHIPIYTFPR